MFTTPPLKKKYREHIELHNTLPECSYKSAFDTFVTWLNATVDVKKVGGMACDGSTLVTFLEECVKSINDKGDIEMPSVMETILERSRANRKDASAQTVDTQFYPLLFFRFFR
jgi:hypothetical protein